MELLSEHGRLIIAVHQHPDVATSELAALAGVSVSDVRRMLNELIRDGVIESVRERGVYCHRTVNMDATLSTFGAPVSVAEVIDLFSGEDVPTTEDPTTFRAARQLADALLPHLSADDQAALRWLADRAAETGDQRFTIERLGADVTIAWDSATTTVPRSAVSSLLRVGLIRGNPTNRVAPFTLTDDGIAVGGLLLQRAR